ncbi:uncharacterized protein B0I36DRAFT_349462 [Microdochium trichocladiopsis]|uniref:Uncharacterized protein n=1 Tax=Microdochium trichocladiopsis TaxID=1682393 RepID=A0A9P9BQY4_9PEZI|nr:uncharacterized protein B0I36DRAFT_349462 [Microdochium trichocladiopsis]KAH7031382.1 hypothetical protein B0I36DRAFT_349462 [Microdochium trichocladiopsis]
MRTQTSLRVPSVLQVKYRRGRTTRHDEENKNLSAVESYQLQAGRDQVLCSVTGNVSHVIMLQQLPEREYGAGHSCNDVRSTLTMNVGLVTTRQGHSSEVEVNSGIDEYRKMSRRFEVTAEDGLSSVQVEIKPAMEVLRPKRSWGRTRAIFLSHCCQPWLPTVATAEHSTGGYSEPVKHEVPTEAANWCSRLWH